MSRVNLTTVVKSLPAPRARGLSEGFLCRRAEGVMLALLLELRSWTFWLVTAAEVLKGAAVVTLSVMAGNGRALVTPPRADVRCRYW